MPVAPAVRSPRGGTRGRTGPHLQPPPNRAAFERPLTFFDLQLCSTPPRPPPSFIDEPHHHLILTRCLVAVQLSTSLASATALVPATSPTNSNGNFDPSFLSPPTTQKASRPVQSSPIQSLEASSILPAALALASKCSLCISTVVSYPPSCHASALCPPSSPPFDRAVGDDRTLPNKRAWLCTGQVACQRYPSGIATPPRRGDAIAEIRERPLSISFGLTRLTSYDTAMAGSSVATSLRLALPRAGCKHALHPETSRRAAVC